ncbi:hypothetical protein [Capnocytophaga cynodegmi]|uniref:Uncharacterized protein n=1 Tax=Capnocytophaga cynodegmi TaxID=28189 RepID=A0A0B7HSL1_9FLAO|nr:hypothetical protein [Capnocytophaga cynodegmi]CEN40558.1 conserved hypothetical protein [Capnocytophaga cynodegmi]
MKELIDKLQHFLSENPQNVVSVTQEGRKLSKNTAPKYAFTLADIQSLFGGLDSFLKELPKQGFQNGTTITLRKMYGFGASATYKNVEEITLNFTQEQKTEQYVPEMTIPQNIIQTPATYQPPMPVAPAMGFVQVTQNELVRNEVIRERFEDLKKENAKLDEELKDAKSEIRQLKDENFSLRLKLDTSEEKHAVDLKRQELDKKGFWESEAGSNIVGALGQVLPMVAERMMQSPTTGIVPTLAMPSVSEIKQQFINIISDPNVTDEQVTHWYNLIFAQNQ